MRAPQIYFLSRVGAALLLVALLAACDDDKTLGMPKKAPGLPDAPSARFVKFEEVTEWTGKPWGSIAEFNLIDSNGAIVDRTKWTATADSSGVNDAPKNAIDGETKSHWHSHWEGPDAPPPPPHWIAVALGGAVKVSGFRYLPRQDGVANGAIAQYRFYVSNDGVTWGEPVAAGDFSTAGTPTAEKVVVFAKQTPNHAPVVSPIAGQKTPMGREVSMSVKATDEDGDELSFASEGLPAGLVIARSSGLITGTPIVPGNYAVSVAVGDNKGPATNMAFDWIVEAAPQAAADAALSPGQMRFAKLEEISEINGNAWASMAEFNLVDASGANLPRTGWVASADSADASDKPGNAIDGFPETIWHSHWDGASPPPPHAFIVDMGHGARIAGFRYLPRQDGLPNGVIKGFRFYTSRDGIDWGKPLAEGDFSTMGDKRSEKTVLIK